MNSLIGNLKLLAVIAGTAIFFAPFSVSATTIPTDDPLFAFCYGVSSCVSDGTIIPVQDPHQFGFYITPGNQTGEFMVDFLVPNNLVSDPSRLGFSISGIQGGAANTSTFSANSSLFSATAWTKDTLSSYLGLSPATGTPLNGIRFWLPLTQAIDPGATGYFVYTFDLGSDTLLNQNHELGGPLLTLDAGVLPAGSLIAAEMLEPPPGPGDIGTSENGGAILVVAEPGSLTLFAVAILGLCVSARYRRRHLRT